MRTAATSCLTLLLCACAAAPVSQPSREAARQPGPAAGAPQEGPPRALEIADLYRLAGVGAPALSPDGSRVVCAVRRQDLAAGMSWSEIWCLDADGSNLRALAAAGKNDSAPRFLPDSRTVLFVSNREQGSQLWTVAIDGGEPRQLTRFAPGLSDPVVSPDGRWIAATAELFPECGLDLDCHARLQRGIEQGKLKVHVADELLYRHWNSWDDGRRSRVVLVEAASGEVVKDLTPGEFHAPIFQLGGSPAYAFSPDSKELCYVQSQESAQAETTNADLWTVAVEGRITPQTARNITRDNPGWDGAPAYSPDGRWIAYVSQETPGYESDLKRLTLYERASGHVRHLTHRGGFDDWVEEARWTADSQAIVFQADHRGRTPLFLLPLMGGEPAEVLRHGTLGGWDLAPDGSIVYARRTVHEPLELFRAAGGTPPQRLTFFNAAVEAELDLRPAEELWFEGEGGYRIHVFVVKPHGFDPARKYPLILNVHGGPQSQWTDGFRGDWQVYPAKGYVVAFANPTGSNGYGQDFCDAIGGDWGGRVYRDLMRVTDALEQLPYVDKQRMGAMGWSYGGYMMMWMQGQTARFRCQAAMMGLFDLESFYGATEELWFPEHDLRGTPWDSEHYQRWSPSNHVESFATPSLVITGRQDYRVPYTQSLQYFTALRKRGVPARLVVFPDAGHWPSWHEMAFYYNAHLDWFHEWLGGEAAPWKVREHARNGAF